MSPLSPANGATVTARASRPNPAVRRIPLADITVNGRLRTLRPEAVESLAVSIREIGLLEAITVTRANNVQYALVSGAHRLEAVKRLGWTEIPAAVLTLDALRSRLAEIDENLVRADLTELEQAQHLAERKRVYETLHPETRHGGDRRSVARSSRHHGNLKRFTEDTAAKNGASERSVFRKVQIGEALEEVADRLKGTPVEDNQAALLTLVGLKSKDAATFARVVDVVADERVPVTEALRRVPRVAQNTGDSEWYTPADYIESAVRVMGGIDLDPASTAEANAVVGAARFYTKDEDGLSRPWAGRVWMNPPYARPLIDRFCARLVQTYAAGAVTEACALVNNATETGWFHALAEAASAVCFPRGRVRFWHPEKKSAPLQGQAVVYFGGRADKFRDQFERLGWTATIPNPAADARQRNAQHSAVGSVLRRPSAARRRRRKSGEPLT